MAHDHDHADDDHDHDHSHVHAPADFGRAFAIGMALNLGFVALEVVYGVLAHSVALLSDAGHNLSDVLGLGAAWLASELVKRAPSARLTYGLRGSSILAALFNAVFLLLTIGAISWEAIQRLFNPGPVGEVTVMAVAAAGVVVNGVTAWLFMSGQKDDINLRGAFLHMASDALVSLGVVVAGLIILMTGWFWLDPAVSLAINVFIVWGTWGLLREALAMSIAAVPSRIDPDTVRTYLIDRPGVASIHDFHVWSMSTTEIALTCHLVMPEGHPGDAFLHGLCEDLLAKFRIGHATFQIETDPTVACALAPDEVV